MGRAEVVVEDRNRELRDANHHVKKSVNYKYILHSTRNIANIFTTTINGIYIYIIEV